MLEFVLAFPLVLLLILGSIQIAHIWVARMVVHYAAYSAARAALVCHTSEYSSFSDGSPHGPERAAERVTAWVVMGERPAETDVTVPGWGDIPGSGAAGRKTRCEVVESEPWNVKATVQLDFALIVPIAGPLIGWSVHPFPWFEGGTTGPPLARDVTVGAGDEVLYPEIELEESVSLSKPYVTVTEAGTGW
jgi:hypothetical protein